MVRNVVMDYREINTVPLVIMENVYKEDQRKIMWNLVEMFGSEIYIDEAFDMEHSETLPHYKLFRDVFHMVSDLTKEKHPLFRIWLSRTKVLKILMTRNADVRGGDVNILSCLEGGSVVYEDETITVDDNTLLAFPSYAEIDTTDIGWCFNIQIRKNPTCE